MKLRVYQTCRRFGTRDDEADKSETGYEAAAGAPLTSGRRLLHTVAAGYR